MSLQAFQAIDETLLLLSEAAQRARRGAREAAAGRAQPHLVEALERTERELHEAYVRLMQDSLGRVEPPERQLELDAA